MLMYLLSIGIIGIGIYLYIKKQSEKQIKPKEYESYQEVPFVVEGSLPIVGHGFSFNNDILGFIRNAYKKYGKIFRIKIFRSELIVVCDRDLTKEFFNIKENEMSLYNVLDRLYFGDAFSDDPKSLPNIITLVKKTIAVRYEEFIPKIINEASKMIERMKETSKQNKNVDIATEMIHFVACTSARCFIAMDLDDYFYGVLVKFTHLLNKLVVRTYFMPKWMLRLIFNRTLTKYRKQMTEILSIEIQKYRIDPAKKDSQVFRACVDWNDDHGEALTDQQIGDIIVCLLYVSSENTALGLSATLIDLARNPEYWNRLTNEVNELKKSGDMNNLETVRSLFNASVLNSCVMESARMNSHIFALNRKPINQVTLGNYWLGQEGSIDAVALCGPMLMVEDLVADDIYHEPAKYNPDRFMNNNGNEPEKMTPNTLMTWGAGVHLCPGKMFAIYEIKSALALITTNFERFEIAPKDMGPVNYFSPSAFAERHVEVKLTPLTETLDLLGFKNQPIDNKNDVNITFNKLKDCIKFKIEYLEMEKGQASAGWIIRNAMTREEQIKYYQEIVELSKNSKEQNEIMNVDPKKAYPITFYNLAYTGTSNCENPKELLDTALLWWMTIRSRYPDDLPNFNPNSFYAQLYGSESVMRVHRDERVNWGVSISLGASCDFLFGTKIIQLHSGDVLIADFSKVDHGVPRIISNSNPGWYSEDNPNIKTFGRVRCSIQIRDIPQELTELMTDSEFKDILGK